MGVAVRERTSTKVIFSQRDDKVSALGATAGEATRQIISRVQDHCLRSKNQPRRLIHSEPQFR